MQRHERPQPSDDKASQKKEVIDKIKKMSATLQKVDIDIKLDLYKITNLLIRMLQTEVINKAEIYRELVVMLNGIKRRMETSSPKELQREVAIEHFSIQIALLKSLGEVELKKIWGKKEKYNETLTECADKAQYELNAIAKDNSRPFDTLDKHISTLETYLENLSKFAREFRQDHHDKMKARDPGPSGLATFHLLVRTPSEPADTNPPALPVETDRAKSAPAPSTTPKGGNVK